jgi:hypothetical protein
VLTALGSRGIGVCALRAQVLASAVSGAPSPWQRACWTPWIRRASCRAAARRALVTAVFSLGLAPPCPSGRGRDSSGTGAGSPPLPGERSCARFSCSFSSFFFFLASSRCRFSNE